ncbi:MAG: hypothetical protein OEV94_10420 [Deltaproteobacteria bacterium]|nr:hypothetical protein [Deltaproteobacteria bacterium]
MISNHETEITKASFDAIISLAESSFKIHFLLYGGTALALLTFLGSTNRDISPGAEDIVGGLICSIAGCLVIAIVTVMAYVTQRLYHASIFDRGMIINIGAVVLIVFSWGVYGYGIYQTRTGISAIVQNKADMQIKEIAHPRPNTPIPLTK